jgi:putative hemolysin
MKYFVKEILILLFSSIGVVGHSQTNGMPCPASAYVLFLGYKEEIRTNQNGEYGVCIFPDGSECNSWEFYRGTCGKKYSYCALKGCETESISEFKDSYHIKYCVCSCTDSLGNKTITRLEEFMEQHGDTLIKYKIPIK